MYQSSNFKYKMASIVNTIHQGPKEIIMIRPGAEGVETKLHKENFLLKIIFNKY